MKYIYQQAGHRFFIWLRSSFGYLWLVLVAGYLAVNVGQSIIKTYHVKQETASLKQQLADMKLEKQRLEALLVYYQSDVYKEKELRRSMLLKKPNEKVYALPEYSDSVSLMDGVAGSSDLVSGSGVKEVDSAQEEKSNWKKWVEYLFG